MSDIGYEGKRYEDILNEHDAHHGFGPLAKKKREMAKKIKLPQPRKLTPAEQKEKTKNWLKAEKGRETGMKAQMGRHEENKEHQKRTGRAWND
jgi:hypothetical protein